MDRKSGRTGFGWIPDLPDHRDKRFSRARKKMKDHAEQESSERKKRKTGSDQEQREDLHVFDGWRSSCEGMRLRLDAAKATRDVAFQRRLERALLDAFPEDEKAIKDGLRTSPLSKAPIEKYEDLPHRVDLRSFMSPVEHQGEIGSCTAQSVVGLVEYLQIVTGASYIDASRLFLYKATRNLYRSGGDTGAHIRDAIKAIRLFGVCPEFYWPYQEDQFDAEPPAFCYAYASNYQGMRYYRLDGIEDVLRSIAQGYPVVLGFTVFESIWEEGNHGLIPYPGRYEKPDGGHAVLAVGFYDHGSAGKKEPNDRDDGGYLIIRNSWGADWGINGYGFLPYRYISGWKSRERVEPLSDDYWTMTQMKIPELGDTQVAPFLVRNA